MRRRSHLIRFKHKPKVVDEGLDEKLRRELPGILAWMIEGEIRRGLAGGLVQPKVIQDATDEYFAGEELIGRWIDEQCVRGIGKRAPTASLYADFQKWAERIGERWVPSEKMFSLRLKDTDGIVAVRSGNIHGFSGIELAGRLPGLDQSPPGF